MHATAKHGWPAHVVQVGIVVAEDQMDDGTPIRLSITIDRRDGSAVFDFEGKLVHGILFIPAPFPRSSPSFAPTNLSELAAKLSIVRLELQA